MMVLSGRGTDKRRRSPAYTVAMVGIMAATVECAKLALSAIPNIEAVSFLLAVFSYTFGWAGFFASIVFVCIEPLIWGFGGWIITYFLYWPFLSLCFLLLGRMRIGNRWILTGVVLVLTAWFGVLSSLVDVGLFSGYWDNFFYRFSIYYMRGIPFYLAQLCCNAVIFPTLFLFLHRKLAKLT